MRTLRNLVLFVALGNAALLWLGYYWLGVGEARATTLLWSLLLAVVGAGLGLWLHGATFAWFQQPKNPQLRTAWREALRHLPALLAIAVLAGAVYYGLSAWNGYSAKPAFRIASWLTLKFRKPVKPATVLGMFHVVLWLARWVLVPVVLLPVISEITGRGWRGFARLRSPFRRGRLWALIPVLLVLALWAPFQLIGWTPRPASFALQVASFVLRFGAAYLLFVAGWIAAAFFSSGGRPPLSQPKTAVSP